MANKRVRTNPSYLEFTATSGGQSYTVTGRGVVVNETLVAALVAAGVAVGVGTAVEDSPLPVTPPTSPLTPEQLATVAETLSAKFVTRIGDSVVTYDSQDRPLTETIPITGGNLVKTYNYNGAGNPSTCSWDFPASMADLVETFTYDSAGRPTGSTFAGA